MKAVIGMTYSSCYTVETVFLKTEVLTCFNGIILTLIADNCLALKSENDRISGSTVGLQRLCEKNSVKTINRRKMTLC